MLKGAKTFMSMLGRGGGLPKRWRRRRRLASLAARLRAGQFDVLTPEVIAQLRSTDNDSR